MSAAPLDVSFRIAAKSGTAAPGTAGSFTGFDPRPAINRQGILLFHASVASVNEGLWAGAYGQIAKVAYEGDTVPGVAGATYASVGAGLDGHVMAGDQGLLFLARMSGSGIGSGNDHVLMAGYPGQTFAPLMRQGAPAPGVTGNFTVPSSLSSGQIQVREQLEAAFAGTVSTGVRGIWRGSPGQLGYRFGTASVFGGNPIVVPVASSYGFLPAGDLYMDAHQASCGLYRITAPGGVSRLHAQGEPSPTANFPFNTSETAGHFNAIACHSPATVLFSGSIITGSGAAGVTYAITGGVTRTLALQGSVIPAIGAKFSFFYETPVGAEDGSMLVTAGLVQEPGVTASNDSVLCYQPPGGTLDDWRPILREGAAVPGFPGLTFAPFFGGEAAVNAGGIVVAKVKVAGSGVTTSNDDALWLWNASTSELQLVCREGSAADFGDGSLRTPAFSPFFRGGAGHSGGRVHGLNNSNQFVFQLLDTSGQNHVILAQAGSQPVFGARYALGPAGIPAISFPTLIGKNYQVESSTTLTGWSSLGPVIAGTGAEVTVPTGAPAPPAGFYRARLLNP